MDPVLFVFIGIGVLLIGLYVWYKKAQSKRERSLEAQLADATTEEEREALQAEAELQKKWGCLTAFLALALVGNLALAGLTFASAVRYQVPLLYLAGSLNLLSAVCAVFVWKRQKWAAYGYIAGVAGVILLNLFIGATTDAARGLLPLALFGIAVQPVWDQLE
ncbi:MAG: hypothetical protein ACP5HM_03125 [Anaerolineae bacterium]